LDSDLPPFLLDCVAQRITLRESQRTSIQADAIERTQQRGAQNGEDSSRRRKERGRRHSSRDK
jgi:hypothetical protein